VLAAERTSRWYSMECLGHMLDWSADRRLVDPIFLAAR